MKLSSITLTFALLAINAQSASAFRVGSDGPSSDIMKKQMEGLLTDIKPPTDTGDEAPPLRNQILGTEVPVSCSFV